VKRKVVYLGGFYHTEFSIQKSFEESEAQIIFLIDDNSYGQGYDPRNYSGKYIDSYHFVKRISSVDLKNFLKSYKPDIIIHRLYHYDPLMHYNGLSIAKELGIPFVYLKQESLIPDYYQENYFNNDILNLNSASLFLYAHPMDENEIRDLSKLYNVKCRLYHYGVSGFEYNMNIPRIKDVGAFGYHRPVPYRFESLLLYLRELRKLGIKLNVYGDTWRTVWEDNIGNAEVALLEELKINPTFLLDDATRIMNEHRIAINVETLSHIDGAFSHKVFQTTACGVPTITYYKHAYERIFGSSGENLIMVKNQEEIYDWLDRLMNDNVLWKGISERCERFVHAEFDWFKRFDKVMKEEGIW
jgi:hypothetical protein